MALGNLTDVKLGSAQVSEIYLGSNLVWQKATAEDSDYLAFVNAAVITDSTQKSAVNYLVTELKSKGLWVKMNAIYPFVGGNANAHKRNLKNPVDSNAAFRLTFNNTTHSVNGVVNGTVATYYTPTGKDDISLHYYSRTNIESNNIQFYTPSGAVRVYLNYSSLGAAASIYIGVGLYRSIAIPDTLGLISFINSGTNLLRTFKNGIKLLNDTESTRVITPSESINITLTHESSFIAFGNSLTDAETLELYNIVQQYQTMLGRAV